VLLATAGRIDIEQGEGFGLDVGEEPGQLFGRQRQLVLMSLNSETVEHGQTLHVEGAAMPQGFRVVSKGGPVIAAAATLTSNTLWTQAMLEQATVVDAQRGGIIGVSARKFGDEQIVIAGGQVHATPLHAHASERRNY
jgi:hypothetical protein